MLSIFVVYYIIWCHVYYFFANCNLIFQFRYNFLKSVTANFRPVNCELGPQIFALKLSDKDRSDSISDHLLYVLFSDLFFELITFKYITHLL